MEEVHIRLRRKSVNFIKKRMVSYLPLVEDVCSRKVSEDVGKMKVRSKRL